MQGTRLGQALSTRVKFSSATIENVLESSRRAIGQTTEGARAIAKKLGHAASQGFESAFNNLPKTQEAAEGAIRSIMSNPAKVQVGEKTIRIIGPDGKGLMIDRATNMFKGFLEGALEK